MKAFMKLKTNPLGFSVYLVEPWKIGYPALVVDDHVITEFAICRGTQMTKS